MITFTRYEFSKHALEQIKERNIPKEVVEEILLNPQQVITEAGYVIYQSIIKLDAGNCLIRIFINEDTQPFKIITAYKTSKINKYYEGEI